MEGGESEYDDEYIPDEHEFIEDYTARQTARARADAANRVFALGDKISSLKLASFNLKPSGTDRNGKPFTPRRGFGVCHDLFSQHYNTVRESYRNANDAKVADDFLLSKELGDALEKTLAPARGLLEILRNHAHRGNHIRRLAIDNIENYIEAAETFLNIQTGLDTGPQR